MTATRRSAVKVGTFARRVEARKRGSLRGSDRADTHKDGDDTLMSGSTVASPQAGASEGGTGFPLGCDPADARGPASDTPWPAPRSHPHKWGPCSAFCRPQLRVAPAATQQAPHLTQPRMYSCIYSSPSWDRAIWADGCVGSSLCRPATRRPRRLVLSPNRLGRARENRSELP